VKLREPEQGCRQTFPAKPLFPNNPATFSQRRSSSTPSPADVFTLKATLPKKLRFLSSHLPRSTNQKLTAVGIMVFSCSQTAVFCLFPALLNIISKYRLQLFEYLCGCATLPSSSLNPLAAKRLEATVQPHLGQRDSPCCRMLREGTTRGSQGHCQWVRSLHGALDINTGLPSPGGPEQLTASTSLLPPQKSPVPFNFPLKKKKQT